MKAAALWSSILLVSAGLTVGCHEHRPTAGPDEYVVPCDRAASGAFASDESYIAFVNAEAAGKVLTDDTRAAVLAPGGDGTVSASSPPMFVLRGAGLAERAPGCGRRPAGGLWAALRGTLVLERRAEAHCPAFSGENFLLRISDAEGAGVYTALLAVPRYTPDAKVWKARMAGRAGQTLTATVQRATFSKGSITEGPFAPATPVMLSVRP